MLNIFIVKGTQIVVSTTIEPGKALPPQELFTVGSGFLPFLLWERACARDKRTYGLTFECDYL